MKKSRLFLLSLTFALLALTLSACAGNAGVASSWPGFTVDEAAETVYLASGPRVYAVNLTNGAERWRFPAEADNKISFYAPPVLAPDGQLLAGAYNNKLYSLNAANGAETGKSWPFTASNRFIDSPLATDTGIFAPSADNNLYALSLDGVQKWKFTAEEPLWSTPSHNAETLFLSSMDHRVYAIEGGSGNLIWKTEELGGAIVDTPAVGDGVLYVGAFNREVIKLDASNGSVLKRYATEGWVWASPLILDDRIYVGDLNGFLYALDLDLNEIWKVNPDTEAKRAITDQPLIVENTVYYSSESGNLFAIDLATGATQWGKKPIDGKLYSSPVLVNEDTLLIAPLGADAPLVALDLNGNIKWSFVPAK